MTPLPETPREVFDSADSNGALACPDCKRKTTHPTPGCGCPPAQTRAGIECTRHINRYHHTCPRKHDFYMYANVSACRRCGQTITSPYLTEFCE